MMHISRSSRLIGIAFLLISGLLISSGWIYLHTVTVPDITVNGGHLREVLPGHIVLRADAPQLNLSLRVPQGNLLSTQVLTIHNLASNRIQLETFPPGTRLTPLSPTTAQLVLPPLPAGIHQLSLNTQPLKNNEVTIAVFGDSQGFDDALSIIVDSVNDAEVDFAIHLGDITPSGQAHQYTSATSVLDYLQIPLYATPGNHDVKGNGTTHFIQNFGALNMAFIYQGISFISLDTSSLGINQTQLSWCEEQLQSAGTRPIIVYTHVPAVDPRPGYDHGFLDNEDAEAFLMLMEQYQVTLVMNGHVHLYNTTIHGGIPYLTSGGAGAALVASPTQGGFHHYVLVTISMEEPTIEPQSVEVPLLPVSVEITNAANFTMTLGLHDLESLASIERLGQFENIYGNFRGYGYYRSVLVSDLLNLIGGMNPNQILVVEAQDGFEQAYGYRNVYPNASWYTLQGDFVLAFQYNETQPPEWSDGPRLAFLPLDGTYSNLDCQATSYPNQGYHEYPSAGARWVRNVIRLQLFEAMSSSE